MPKVLAAYTGTHAGIIDKSTFDTAQTLIKQNTKTSPGSKQLHLFSGLVKCADCGKGMARKVSKGIAYYACRTHTEKLQTRCTKHSIREDVLEKSVLAAIQMQVSLVEDMSEKVRKINESPTVKKESVLLRNLLAQKEDELMRHSTIMDALYPDLKNGLITQDEYVRLKSGYAEEIKRINESIDKLRKENLEAANGVANESSYLKAFLQYKNIHNLTRGILVELVKAIYVHEGGKLEIEFRFGDQYQRIQEFISINQNAVGSSSRLAV